MSDGTIDLSSAAGDEMLADFIPALKKLSSRGDDPAGGLQKMARELERAPFNGFVQLSLRSGRSKNHWCLALTPGGCELIEGRSENPDLEILTDTETWSAIASGDLSPLAAFVSGKMRVQGDVTVARMIARRLS